MTRRHTSPQALSAGTGPQSKSVDAELPLAAVRPTVSHLGRNIYSFLYVCSGELGLRRHGEHVRADDGLVSRLSTVQVCRR